VDAILTAAAIALGTPLAALLVGWGLLRHVRDLDAGERFAAALPLGLAALAGGQFLGFATGLDPAQVALVVVLLAAGTGLMAGARPRATAVTDPWLPALFLLGYLQLLLIEAVLPLFAGGNWYFDWWMHYDAALVFLGQRDPMVGWSRDLSIASRNPLFNLAAAVPLAFGGGEFWAWQAAAAAVSAAVLPAFHLVLRGLFGARIAFLGAGLACLNIWLMHLVWFTWSKALVAAFLLLALHFHLRALRRPAGDLAGEGRDFAAFWLASVLAFLTHQLAAPYVAALLAHGLFRAWRRGALRAYLAPGRLAGYAVATLALLLPWYGWLLAHVGPERMLASSPLVAMNAEPVTAGALLRAMMVNLLHSILPVFIDLPRGPIQAADLQRWLTRIVFNHAIAAVTAAQAFGLLVLLRRRLTVRGLGPPRGPAPGAAAATALACFALAGAALSLPLHPREDPYGLLAANLFPAMLAGLIWIAGLLGRFAGRRLLVLVVALAAAEYLVLFWTYLPAVPWLDTIAANTDLKAENRLVFLADLLGPARPLAMGALAAVQAALCALLALRMWRTGAAAAGLGRRAGTLPAGRLAG